MYILFIQKSDLANRPKYQRLLLRDAFQHYLSAPTYMSLGKEPYNPTSFIARTHQPNGFLFVLIKPKRCAQSLAFLVFIFFLSYTYIHNRYLS
jgi:hypothetical protein